MKTVYLPFGHLPYVRLLPKFYKIDALGQTLNATSINNKQVNENPATDPNLIGPLAVCFSCLWQIWNFNQVKRISIKTWKCQQIKKTRLKFCFNKTCDLKFHNNWLNLHDNCQRQKKVLFKIAILNQYLMEKNTSENDKAIAFSECQSCPCNVSCITSKGSG